MVFCWVLGPLHVCINELPDRTGHSLIKVAGNSKVERLQPGWKMGFIWILRESLLEEKETLYVSLNKGAYMWEDSTA